ncbi:MAG: 50S ribosomal protein L10 [Chloroflexi bacterium]|nr:50S ribosomal protein L10 [Chloroflexota bacterium]
MAITKAKKEQLVADYAEKLARSKAIILTDYRGLTMAELTDLRRQLRGVGAEYHIVKNRLVRLAMSRAGRTVPEDLLTGPIGIGFCFDDAVAVAKAIVEYAQSARTFEIKGAVMGDSILSATDVTTLATLPPKEAILAQVLAAIQSPTTGLLGVLDAALRNVLYVLQARVEQLGGVAH